MFVQIGGINYMHQVCVSTLMLEGGYMHLMHGKFFPYVRPVAYTSRNIINDKLTQHSRNYHFGVLTLRSVLYLASC